MKTLSKTITAGLSLMMLAGCERLAGPAYELPTAPVVNEWSGTTGPEAGELAGLRSDWWQEFGNAQLSELVGASIAGNIDLQVAAGRIDRAMALAGVAESRTLPSLSGSASAVFQTGDSATTAVQGNQSFQLGAGLNWEIDLWGKLAKGQEAAGAEILASGADWRSAYLQLTSEVARQYFRVLQLNELIEVYSRYISSSSRILGIYEARAEESIVSADVVLRQRAELIRLEREQQDLERDRRIVANALSALLGQAPGAVEVPVGNLREGVMPVSIPVGLPSELLERRPDILAGEYRVLAAWNLMGQARLDRLPSIALTGSAGSSSQQFSGLLNQWLVGGGPVVTMPFLDPAKKAQVQVREADLKIASDQYRGTVVRAFQEVQDALINLASRGTQLESANAALQILKDANTLTLARFEEGLLSQLEVLENERSLLQAEQVALDVHARYLNDMLVLYKAIGGGWSRDTLMPVSLD
jgi:NodT family efflux transporter outer membrane factor (OMF) lipoprotein